MMPLLFRSIRARLTATFSLSVALLLLVADVSLLEYSRIAASRHANRALREGAEKLQTALADAIDEANEAKAAARANQKTAGNADADVPSAALLSVRDTIAEERVVAAVFDRRRGFWTEDAGPAFANRTPLWLTQNPTWRIRRLGPIPGGDNFTAYVGYPLAQLHRQADSQAALLIVLSGFVVAITAIGTYVLIGRTLLPIDRLAQQTERHYKAPPALGLLQLQASSNDSEIVRLVATLNALLARLASDAESKGRFYAAAAHELRTPLHVLAGQIELTLSRPRSAAEYEASLRNAEQQTDRLIFLVQSLLLLNRMDRGSEPRALAPVNVMSVCESQLKELSQTIAERALAVQVTAPETSGVAEVDPEQLRILLRNLLDNAVRYAAQGSTVELQLRCEGNLPGSPGAVSIELTNTTEEAALQDLDILFEPFYRPDPSRSARTGGNGLGLSICRSIAEANGWLLQMRALNGAVQASLTLPEAQ